MYLASSGAEEWRGWRKRVHDDAAQWAVFEEEVLGPRPAGRYGACQPLCCFLTPEVRQYQDLGVKTTRDAVRNEERWKRRPYANPSTVKVSTTSRAPHGVAPSSY